MRTREIYPGYKTRLNRIYPVVSDIIMLAVKRNYYHRATPSWIVETNITQEISKGDATCTKEPNQVEELFNPRIEIRLGRGTS